MEVKVHNDINGVLSTIESIFNKFISLFSLFTVNDKYELSDTLLKRARKILLFHDMTFLDFLPFHEFNKIETLDITRNLDNTSNSVNLIFRFDSNKPICKIPSNHTIHGKPYLLVDNIWINIETDDFSGISIKVSDIVNETNCEEIKFGIYYVVEYTKHHTNTNQLFDFPLRVVKDDKYLYFYLNSEKNVFEYNMSLEAYATVKSEKFYFFLFLDIGRAKGINTDNVILTNINLLEYLETIKTFVEQLKQNYSGPISVKHYYDESTKSHHITFTCFVGELTISTTISIISVTNVF